MTRTPVYMDSHATTRVDPRVVQAMLPCFDTEFGNAASRTHAFGWRAEEAVTRARTHMARLIGADPKEIVFTSGATESDNLAIFGAFEALRSKGDHIVTGATEHHAVLDPVARLQSRGARVTVLPVDRDGRVDPGDVRRAITGRTVLVSLMFANNEVGTLHPVAEIGAICKEAGVLFHSDAAQAVGKVPVDVQTLGVDLLSMSAHKAYGPKGVGALFVRRKNPRVALEPILFGGGHERGLRSGTLNVPGIVGFGEALRIAAGEYEDVKATLEAAGCTVHGRPGDEDRCLLQRELVVDSEQHHEADRRKQCAQREQVRVRIRQPSSDEQVDPQADGEEVPAVDQAQIPDLARLHDEHRGEDDERERHRHRHVVRLGLHVGQQGAVARAARHGQDRRPGGDIDPLRSGALQHPGRGRLRRRARRGRGHEAARPLAPVRGGWRRCQVLEAVRNVKEER